MTAQSVLSPLGGPAPPGCVPRRSLVLPRSGPLRCREGGSSVREATSLAEIGAVPSVGQPGERRDRTPESLNAFSRAELVVGPGRGAFRDVSHREAVTVSSFPWWWNPDTGLSRRPSLGDRSPRLRAGRRGRRSHHQRGSNPLRSLQGSQGELRELWRTNVVVYSRSPWRRRVVVTCMAAVRSRNWRPRRTPSHAPLHRRGRLVATTTRRPGAPSLPLIRVFWRVRLACQT